MKFRIAEETKTIFCVGIIILMVAFGLNMLGLLYTTNFTGLIAGIVLLIGAGTIYGEMILEEGLEIPSDLKKLNAGIALSLVVAITALILGIMFIGIGEANVPANLRAISGWIYLSIAVVILFEMRS